MLFFFQINKSLKRFLRYCFNLKRANLKNLSAFLLKKSGATPGAVKATVPFLKMVATQNSRNSWDLGARVLDYVAGERYSEGLPAPAPVPHLLSYSLHGAHATC